MVSFFSASGRRPGFSLGAQVVLLLSLTGLSVQQRDPIKDFCRRWGHQAAVVDEKLYYDGGLVTYNGDNTHQNSTNPYLIWHDLSVADPSGMPPPYANLSKNSTIPNVNGGVLWADSVNKRIYLYGGQFYNEKPWSGNILYSYDIIENNWQSTTSPQQNSIARLAYGAGVSVSETGKAFYYGGWTNNNTDPNWNGPGAMTSYMLEYSMDDDSWTNNTGPDSVGRAEGVMLYLPAGDGGLLAYFGGIAANGSSNATAAQPMNQILIFDPVSGKSYLENATGDVPPNRRQFCAGVAWADDYSSYNIYLYGGLPAQEDAGPGFDDIYVLSLPSFTWTKFYPTDNSNGTVPHHGLTCNIVQKGQMIVQGGFFPLDDKCDSPAVWGLHNMDMGRQNKDSAIWGLYDPKKTDYVVPSPLVTVIGGQPTGGATLKAPKSGWKNADLEVLMTRTPSIAARTPTRAIPTATGSHTPSKSGSSNKLSTGAIAGIAVGAAVGGIALIALVWFFFWKRFKARKAAQVTQHQPLSQQPHDPSMSQVHSPGGSYFPSHQAQGSGAWGYSNSGGGGNFSTTSSPPPFHNPSPSYGHAQPHATELPVEMPASKYPGYSDNSPHSPHEAPSYDAPPHSHQ